MEKEKKYLVLNGATKENGDGDIDCVLFETNNFKEALKAFNKYKHSKEEAKGWLKEYKYLETCIISTAKGWDDVLRYERAEIKKLLSK